MTITNDRTLTPAIQQNPIIDKTGRIITHTITAINAQGQKEPIITLIIAVYGYQRGYKTTHKRQTNNPKILEQNINKTIKLAKSTYHNPKIILLGDLQHTLNNTTHRTITLLTAPPHNILNLSTSRHNLTSIIPEIQPNIPYLTHTGNKAMAGIDHILTKKQHVKQITTCGIDKNTTGYIIPSDHAMVFTDMSIIPEPQTQTTHKQIKYLYKHIDQIPLIMNETEQMTNTHRRTAKLVHPRQTVTNQNRVETSNTYHKKIYQANEHHITKKHIRKTELAINTLQEHTQSIASQNNTQQHNENETPKIIPRTQQERKLLDKAYKHVRK